jgi:hypothetical protein
VRDRRSPDDSAQSRLDAADRRDALADARDEAANARDQDAVIRDLLLAARDVGDARSEAETLAGAADLHALVVAAKRAAESRRWSAELRACAAADREASGRDRGQAARDRRSARADRMALVDGLRAGSPGATPSVVAPELAVLDAELERCRRWNARLVVACLSSVEHDARRAAQTEALTAWAIALVKARVRSYDVIIRHQHDEFLCAMTNVPLAVARHRLGGVASASSGAVRTGFAELEPDDCTVDLVARARRDSRAAQAD